MRQERRNITGNKITGLIILVTKQTGLPPSLSPDIVQSLISQVAQAWERNIDVVTLEISGFERGETIVSVTYE